MAIQPTGGGAVGAYSYNGTLDEPGMSDTMALPAGEVAVSIGGAYEGTATLERLMGEDAWVPVQFMKSDGTLSSYSFAGIGSVPLSVPVPGTYRFNLATLTAGAFLFQVAVYRPY